MEREIANVAAASAMRGFRYMAFPPIVFETHPVAAVVPVWEPARAPRLLDPASAAAPAPRAISISPSTDARLAAPQPMTGWHLPAMMATSNGPALPVAAPPQPAPSTAERRFALLTEVSAELHRRASP